MSKDPGYSDSKSDRQESQIRVLTEENKKLQEMLAEASKLGFDLEDVEDIDSDINAVKKDNSRLDSLVKRMKEDYIKDMAYKDKKIKFLEDECKRIYDPIREFWNIEKNEEMDFLIKELKKTKYENEMMKQALMDASEYARTDDVNGEAGDIAKDCLNKLFNW